MEIVPIEVPQRKGELKLVDTDEQPRPVTSIEGFARLRTIVRPDGTEAFAAQVARKRIKSSRQVGVGLLR